jgi:hypothetical protein
MLTAIARSYNVSHRLAGVGPDKLAAADHSCWRLSVSSLSWRHFIYSSFGFKTLSPDLGRDLFFGALGSTSSDRTWASTPSSSRHIFEP